MATDITVRRHGGALFPATDYDKDLLYNRIKHGAEARASISIPRSLSYHKRYFVFLHWVWENTDASSEFTSFDSWRKVIEMYAGHYEQAVSLNGKPMYLHKSIKFAPDCDETVFRGVAKGVFDVIWKKYFAGNPAWTEDQLMIVLELEQ